MHESIYYSGCALTVAVAVLWRVVDHGGDGAQSEAEVDKIEPPSAAGSFSCAEHLDEGVDCAMDVTAARASAEPVPPSIYIA